MPWHVKRKALFMLKFSDTMGVKLRVGASWRPRSFGRWLVVHRWMDDQNFRGVHQELSELCSCDSKFLAIAWDPLLGTQQSTTFAKQLGYKRDSSCMFVYESSITPPSLGAIGAVLVGKIGHGDLRRAPLDRSPTFRHFWEWAQMGFCQSVHKRKKSCSIPSSTPKIRIWLVQFFFWQFVLTCTWTIAIRLISQLRFPPTPYLVPITKFSGGMHTDRFRANLRVDRYLYFPVRPTKSRVIKPMCQPLWTIATSTRVRPKKHSTKSQKHCRNSYSTIPYGQAYFCLVFDALVQMCYA